MTGKAKLFASFIFLSLFAVVLAAPALFLGGAKPAAAAYEEKSSGIGLFLAQMEDSGEEVPEPEAAGPEAESDEEEETAIDKLLERLRKVGRKTAGGAAEPEAAEIEEQMEAVKAEILVPAAGETAEGGPGAEIAGEILLTDDEKVADSEPAAESAPQEDTTIEELLERLRKVGVVQQAEPADEAPPEGDTVFAIPELEERTAREPASFDLGGCIASALESNKLLRQKQADLDKVEGQDLVDKSRFRPHFSMLGNVERKKGTLSKSFYPSHNPPTSITSAGSVDVGGVDLESFSASDISSLTGMDEAEISALAAQYGIALRPAVPIAPEAPGPAQRTALQQVCFDVEVAPGQTQQVCVDVPEGTFPTSEQITAALVQAALGTSSTSSDARATDNELYLQLSKRIVEFGKEAPSTLTVRANLRSALYNFEQNRREVISNVRRTFFLVLLKREQIRTRQKLMGEYEEKLTKLQKRFEIAKDVPRLDVLTAELDVINEKLRINGLRNDLVNYKLELLQLMGRPMLADEVLFQGEFQPFDYTLAEIVGVTKKNSYQLAYLDGELLDQQREFDDIIWDYRPTFSSKLGLENQWSTIGMALNKSGSTYGVDFGVQHYLNIPKSYVVSSNSSEDRFFVDFSIDYPIHKGTERRGIRKQELQALNNLKAQFEEQDEQLELTARQAYQDYIEALERVKLQGEKAEISRRRLEITRTLREHGKVAEFQLDSYRNSFFSDQDRLFSEQENVIVAQENLRKIMGVFDD